MPSSHDIPAEWNRWVNKWHKLHEEPKPNTLIAALRACDMLMFPNIHTLLKLLCTLPITTTECERTISRLKTLKTCLRSSIGQERLNGLALMRIHRDKPVDVKQVIDNFALRYRTRMTLKTADLLTS